MVDNSSLSSNCGHSQILVENGKTSLTYYGIWGQPSKTRQARGKNSCRESLKIEQEVLVLAEEMKAQGSVDENTRAMIIRGLKSIKKKGDEEETFKIREEEETFKELLEDAG